MMLSVLGSRRGMTRGGGVIGKGGASSIVASPFDFGLEPKKLFTRDPVLLSLDRAPSGFCLRRRKSVR